MVFWDFNIEHLVAVVLPSLATRCPEKRTKGMDVADYDRFESVCWP